MDTVFLICAVLGATLLLLEIGAGLIGFGSYHDTDTDTDTDADHGNGLFGMLSVEGPMARDVEDLALMLDAMAGAERRDPMSLPSDATGFLAAARGGPLPRRVAFSRDLGVTPVEPEVAASVEAAAAKLAAAGVIVEEAHPDLREAHDCFQVLRALAFATGLKDLLARHGDALKPEIVWNVEKGLKLTVEEIVTAEQQRVAADVVGEAAVVSRAREVEPFIDDRVRQTRPPVEHADKQPRAERQRAPARHEAVRCVAPGRSVAVLTHNRHQDVVEERRERVQVGASA